MSHPDTLADISKARETAAVSHRVLHSAVDTALARLDAWFETMRCQGGFGGPVAHWWQQSLMYTGAALDWRYEGIIAGYLLLWERTRNERWLAKACRAGDDLVAGQQANGHFTASAFEMNPAVAGTPHEAACDSGLLLLARALRRAGRRGWEDYAACAERNLRAFYIAQLWDSEVQAFRDSLHTPSFVPNKAATACEALFLLADVSGEDRWVAAYAIPTLNRIVAYQVHDGGQLDGAIAQNSLGSRKIDKYFPVYIARCVPALLQGYQWTQNEQYAECALRAMRFIARWVSADGAIPTVIYPNRRVNRFPSWIAPLGDILNSADTLAPLGFDADFSTTRLRLLAGQDASGGIQTASGFEAQAGSHPGGTPDLRDVLHVAGWCDKAFRYLAASSETDLPREESRPFETACTFRGKSMWLVETSTALEVTFQGRVCYRWMKGDSWPQLASPDFWLR